MVGPITASHFERNQAAQSRSDVQKVQKSDPLPSLTVKHAKKVTMQNHYVRVVTRDTIIILTSDDHIKCNCELCAQINENVQHEDALYC